VHRGAAAALHIIREQRPALTQAVDHAGGATVSGAPSTGPVANRAAMALTWSVSGPGGATNTAWR